MNISQETLDRALQSSALNASGEQLCRLSAAELFDLYDSTLRQIADTIAPSSTSVQRIRRLSPWFDEECRKLVESRGCSSDVIGDLTPTKIAPHGSVRCGRCIPCNS